MSNAHSQVMKLLTGYMVTQALHVVASLGVADEIARGTSDVNELAAKTGVDGDALFRMLRALASVDLFVEVGPRAFGLTPAGELLRDGVPGSLRHVAILFGTELYRAWGSALQSVQTGKPAFDAVFGQPHFEYLDAHPEASSVFDRAMAGGIKPRLAALDGRSWDGVETVVDVGGGAGALLTALLSKHAHLRGILFDRESVTVNGKAHLARSGLSARCEVRAGSFFESVPADGDVYVLARILHDWHDADCKRILKNCRTAMKPSATLVVVDDVLPAGPGPHPGKWLDLQMLVINGGRERSEPEWRALLESEGFRLARVFDGGLGLEATPI